MGTFDLKTHVKINYTNYKGVTAWYTILPLRIYFGSTEWHPKDQWLLEAFKLTTDKAEKRSFAMCDIKEWIFDSNQFGTAEE